MTTIRSFIAIELSDEARMALTSLQNRLKTVTPPQSVRWTPPTSIHLTLHFLGDIMTEDVAKVTGLLQTAATTCPPFKLSLSGLGCFPNTRRPRIVWAGVKGETQTLVQLQQDLGQKLKAIGFSLDARPYAPHLTLGRVKEGLPQHQLTQLGQTLEQAQEQIGPLASLSVTEISLMRSDLKPAGPVYTQMNVAMLEESRE